MSPPEQRARPRLEPQTGSVSTHQSGHVTSLSWFKAYRNPEALQLLEAKPKAFILLYVIAYRARWNNDGFNPHGLEVGEALIGDYKSCGMSEREYRTAKSCLEKWEFATFKTTNRGTIATLADSKLFGVSTFANDEQPDRQTTDKRQASDRQKTTNIEGKEGIQGVEAHTDPAHTTPSADRPNEAEVLAFANRIGLADWKALDWFNEMEGCGWLDYNHRPIVAWQPVLTRVKAKWEADGRPSAPPSVLTKQPASSFTKPQEGVWHITKQVEAAQAEIYAFKAANGHEDAFGWNPNDEAAKTQYRALAAKLRTLKAKLTTQ